MTKITKILNATTKYVRHCGENPKNHHRWWHLGATWAVTKNGVRVAIIRHAPIKNVWKVDTARLRETCGGTVYVAPTLREAKAWARNAWAFEAA